MEQRTTSKAVTETRGGICLAFAAATCCSLLFGCCRSITGQHRVVGTSAAVRDLVGVQTTLAARWQRVQNKTALQISASLANRLDADVFVRCDPSVMIPLDVRWVDVNGTKQTRILTPSQAFSSKATRRKYALLAGAARTGVNWPLVRDDACVEVAQVLHIEDVDFSHGGRYR